MDSQGVTAVVGTLLIVGVLILAAVGAMYWGVPAIRELRDRDTFDHVVRQASRFNEEMRSLVLKGDPQNAARPVMNVPGGTLQVTDGDRVIVAFMIEAPDFAALPETQLYTNPYNISFLDWGDDDHDLSLKNVGKSFKAPLWQVRFTVQEVRGESVKTLATTAPAFWNKGAAPIAVNLGAGYSMQDKVLRVVGENVTVGTGATAQFMEAWIMDVGALEYEIGTGANLFGFSLEDGALLLEKKGDTFVEQTPLVQFPDRQVNHETFTWRFLQLNGTSGAGGTGSMRYPFFLSLIQNAPRLDGPAASLVRLYVNGTHEVAWWNLLEALGPQVQGKSQVVKLGPTPDDGLQYARRTGSSQYEPFAAKLVHSEILVRVTPGG